MNKKVYVSVVVLVLAIAGMWYLVKQPVKETGPREQENIVNNNSNSEQSIITSLKANWQSIQANIPFRPTHPGTIAWGGLYTVQFIGENVLIVSFEDGYNPGIAVLNFKDGKFNILETFKNQADFEFSDWENLVKKYGESSYPISTYTLSVLRGKEIVSFQTLTKVPENVFLRMFPKSDPTKEIALELLKDKLFDPKCGGGEYKSCTVDIKKIDNRTYDITVTYDGLHDDSAKAVRYETTIKYEGGKWIVGNVSKTQQCWLNRGHQDFSTEFCS